MLARAFGPARTWAYVDGVVHYEVDLATLLSPVAA
jgi:hypothetical protein